MEVELRACGELFCLDILEQAAQATRGRSVRSEVLPQPAFASSTGMPVPPIADCIPSIARA